MKWQLCWALPSSFCSSSSETCAWSREPVWWKVAARLSVSSERRIALSIFETSVCHTVPDAVNDGRPHRVYTSTAGFLCGMNLAPSPSLGARTNFSLSNSSSPDSSESSPESNPSHDATTEEASPDNSTVACSPSSAEAMNPAGIPESITHLRCMSSRQSQQITELKDGVATQQTCTGQRRRGFKGTCELSNQISLNSAVEVCLCVGGMRR